MAKLGVVSLGCSKNLVDTEVMLGQLIGAGWELTHDLREAQLILINTCGFIGPAKEESIRHILEAVQYKGADRGVCSKVVVTGCLVQRYAAELRQEIPEVDLWISLGEIGELAQLVENGPGHEPDLDREPFLNDRNLRRFQATVPHLAYVKIAEGCNHRCSYCAIPLIKGKFRSRSPEAVLEEVKSLVQAGVREINLIAQDITMYGVDLHPRTNLTELLKKLIDQAGPAWIRLLYAYPSGITPELLQLMAEQPSVCNYLDLPIQHINGRILKLMNRHDSPELIKERLAEIRTALPGVVLRTSLIVGLPTETAAEFEELRQFVAEGFFQQLGVFAYSREEGTAAYSLKPQISAKEKERRRQLIMEEQREVTARFLEKQVGTRQIILVDQAQDGRGIGRTAGFAPEVDGVVSIAGMPGSAGRFILGEITGYEGYNLNAKYLTEG
jgi:ribosomal protein S12 methylthiotransferase